MRITSSRRKFHIQQVLEATVISQNSTVGGSTRGKDQATLLVARCVVLHHSKHVKVAALLHGRTDLDLDIQPDFLVLLELVKVLCSLEGLPLLLRPCVEKEELL